LTTSVVREGDAPNSLFWRYCTHFARISKIIITLKTIFFMLNSMEEMHLWNAKF